ncbi:MAG: hypothetical protein C4305_04595 [Thermoleophilia bacterium]
MRRYGLRPPKLVRYPGLKEEYYLADFRPNPLVLDELGVDRDRVVVVLRPPPDVSLYHRRPNPLFLRLLQVLGRRRDVHAVVLPRTAEQRALVRSDCPRSSSPIGRWMARAWSRWPTSSSRREGR